jgi:MOSC domain-containing protein YiiM
VQRGWIEEILVGPTAVSLPRSVTRVQAVAGRGLEGDRYHAGTGTWSNYPVRTGIDLTLIEAEVLEAVGLPSPQARRNLVTRGIRLNQLVGKRFRIGDIDCYADRLCEPCTHLSQLTGVSVAALLHRGGLRADILNDGAIAIGDTIVLTPAHDTLPAPG